MKPSSQIRHKFRKEIDAATILITAGNSIHTEVFVHKNGPFSARF
jgi:hypothetical protein